MARRLGRTMPHSVTKPAMSAAGVTSKAGLRARTPGAATRTEAHCPSGVAPATSSTSLSSRSSIGIPRPDGQAASNVGEGAAT